MHRQNRALIVALTLPLTMVLLLAVSACGGDEGPAEGRTLRLILPEETSNLDILLGLTAAEESVQRDNFNDALTWQDADTMEMVPTQSTVGWEMIDPRRWRFELRTDARFHNGEPLTVEDAVFSINWQGDAANGTDSYGYTGPISAEAVDDSHVDIVCEADCPILPRTTMFVGMTDKEYVEEAGETRNVEPVGLGPYKFTEWRKGQYIRGEAHPDFIAIAGVREMQAPFVDQVEWVFRSEAAVRAAMVDTGEADWAFGIGVENSDNVPQAKSGGSAEVFGLTLDTIWHPELKKRDVRRALAHAINCQEMVDSLYNGQTICRGNVAWPGVLGVNERNAAPYEYDPEMAETLLADAGYDPANEVVITTRAGRVFKDVEVMEAIAGYWEAIGVNARVQVLETGGWLEHHQTGCGRSEDPLNCGDLTPPEPLYSSPGIYANVPSNETLDFGRQVTFYMNCEAPNSHVCDPDIQPMVTQATSATGDERQRLLTEMADHMHDDVLQIGLFDAVVVYGMAEDLVWEPRFDRRVRASTMSFE